MPKKFKVQYTAFGTDKAVCLELLRLCAQEFLVQYTALESEKVVRLELGTGKVVHLRNFMVQ